MNLGIPFPSRMILSDSDGSQTFLNNTDFQTAPPFDVFGSSFYCTDVNNPDDIQYGWQKILDNGDGTTRILGDEFLCNGKFVVQSFSTVSQTFRLENTAIISGGEVYDIIFRAAGGAGSEIIHYDAFINGVAQNVGGSVEVTNINAGTCEDGFYNDYAGQIDASGIGNFKFIFGGNLTGVADINVRSIQWTKQ